MFFRIWSAKFLEFSCYIYIILVNHLFKFTTQFVNAVVYVTEIECFNFKQTLENKKRNIHSWLPLTLTLFPSFPIRLEWNRVIFNHTTKLGLMYIPYIIVFLQWCFRRWQVKWNTAKSVIYICILFSFRLPHDYGTFFHSTSVLGGVECYAKGSESKGEKHVYVQ